MLKKIFNSYHTILIILIILLSTVIIYTNNIMKKCDTYIFEGKNDYVEITSGVIALNYNMNLFEGSSIQYLKNKDIIVKSYDIGYYILNGDEYLPLASIASDDNEYSLKKILEGKDTFRIYEFNKNNYYFTKDKINNLDNLYFIIKAVDNKNNEINEVLKLDVIKLTK